MNTYEPRGEILEFIPSHKKVEELIEAYFEGAEENRLMSYNKGWVTGSANRFYEKLCAEYQGVNEDIADILGRLAFTLAINAFYYAAAKFVIADKIGFLPPKIK